jgi:DNA-binding XRE family transcriptional regulator
MQVHVKTPHIKINIDGAVSKKLLKLLKEDYGKNVIIEEDEFILARDMAWYKETSKQMSPNVHMRLYRETRGLTQVQLGKKLGGISRQRISDMEKGRRPINKEIAKKLAGLFNTSVEKFL